MTTPAGLGINPFFCGEDQQAENFEKIIEQLTHALPRVACALENWRYVEASMYPSHPTYPACPSLAQMPYVMVGPDKAGDPDVKVIMPCPRAFDPNIEQGDSVLYHQDVNGNALYQGGYDQPIGSVKWWHGKPSEVPRGWYWITDAGPTKHTTRTGRFAAAFGKYVKNFWQGGGTNPELGTLGQSCDGRNVAVTVGPHDFIPLVSVADHGLDFTSTEFTDITLNCVPSYLSQLSEPYVAESCLSGMYGYVDIKDHTHMVDIQEITIGQGLETPITVAAKNDVCSQTATVPPCGSPLPPVPVNLYEGCHTHYLYWDLPQLYEGACTLNDPGHFHAYEPPPHEVTVAPIHLDHSVSVTPGTNPRVYFLLLERLNNAANAPTGAMEAGENCEAYTEP